MRARKLDQNLFCNYVKWGNPSGFEVLTALGQAYRDLHFDLPLPCLGLYPTYPDQALERYERPLTKVW